MRSLFFSFVVLIPFLSFSQYQLSGYVTQSEDGSPLSGATVRVENTYIATFTDQDGNFRLRNLPSDTYKISLSYIGYKKESKTIFLDDDLMLNFSMEPSSVMSEEVLVSATRVKENSAYTATNLSEKEIEENNLGQDIPYLLQKTPSIITTSDAGAGVGYTGMRIRGIDQNRINVTINGIPVNDAESHGAFWINMPDLASSLENVQVQRGVGTSTNGAGAFGASINMQTSGYQAKPFAEVNNSFGSFNTRKHTAMFGSGLLNDKFAFEGRLSRISSDGYVDRASSDLKSYFLSGGYYGRKSIIKAVVFGGDQKTYQSWYGTPESRVKGDTAAMRKFAENNWFSREQTENLFNSGRNYNYYTYYNQTDNYKQQHYQLHFSHHFSQNLDANFSLHYTAGAGYYEDFLPDQKFSKYLLNDVYIGGDTISKTDLVRQKWLDNDFYGFTYSVMYKPVSNLKLTLGGGYNRYEGDHFGHIIWAEYTSNSFPDKNFYFNLGEKQDFNTFLKAEYEISSSLHLFADAQFRNINYEVNGTDDDQTILNINENYQFLNPKIGANYALNSSNSIYGFLGIAHREPNRTDIIDKPDDVEMKPEQLKNLELGYQLKKKKFYASLNFYYMDYDNQLVLTGELNDIGTPLKQNVKESYRTGVETQAGVRLHEKVLFSGNATISRNKMLRDEIGETDLSFSPQLITYSELEIRPVKNLKLALSHKYVDKQYLDNSSSESKKIPRYYFVNFAVSYELKNLFNIDNIQLLFHANNITDRMYSTNGWTYSYENNYGEFVIDNYYYPQAGRNYMVGLNLKF